MVETWSMARKRGTVLSKYWKSAFLSSPLCAGVVTNPIHFDSHSQFDGIWPGKTHVLDSLPMTTER